MPIKKISVFMASNPTGPFRRYHEWQARRLARAIVREGWIPVSGGGGGLMKVFRMAVTEAGGVNHLIHLNRYPPEEGTYGPTDILEGHDELCNRQNPLIYEGDASAAIGGGFGTLYETFQVCAGGVLNENRGNDTVACIGIFWCALYILVQLLWLVSGTISHDPSEHMLHAFTPEGAVRKLIRAHAQPRRTRRAVVTA